VSIALATVPLVKKWLKPDEAKTDSSAKPELARLVQGQPDTLELPAEVAKALGIQTAAVKPAPPSEPLRLSGTLFLDPSRLARVHSSFAGRVVSIASTQGTSEDPSVQPYPVDRPIRFGDSVKKNQLLAVVWSKDLGEKKSELVDGISRERMDRETMQRLRELSQNGSVPERSLREAERNLEADRIAVERAENTLRSWGLKDPDINEIHTIAKTLTQQRAQNATAGDANANDLLKKWTERWAMVEVRAPSEFDGVILEMNCTVGDVVDTTLDLFKIANLSKLRVLVHAYEEDLPLLQRIRPDQRLWSIQLKSEPDGKSLESGGFDQIGHIIDPMQHTAVVMGWVLNPEDTTGQRKLRVGQFITATVPQPIPDDQVVIPRNALLEEGRECSVLVQSRPGEPCYTRQSVAVVRRCRDIVYVKSALTDDEKKQGIHPLKAVNANEPGDQVVVSGALELAAALDDLKSSVTAKP